MRLSAEREGGVNGGVLQLEGTGVGDFIHRDSLVKFSNLVRDVVTAHRDVLIASCCHLTAALVPFQE